MKAKISICRVASNPTVRFINGHVTKYMVLSETINNGIMGVICSETSDNKTTYVQQKVWDESKKAIVFPPYAECGYVI